jgi:hypothetical protein
MTGQAIKVISSSSTSNRVTSVFGNRIQSFGRYAHRITSAEAVLLATRPSADGITAAILTELPFQVAAEKLKRLQVSLVELATFLAEDLLTNYRDASNQQAYFYLQMTADGIKKGRRARLRLWFFSRWGPLLRRGRKGGCYFIAEYRDGFAAEVIAIMRSRQGDYSMQR